jgi:hypothetical protein
MSKYGVFETIVVWLSCLFVDSSNKQTNKRKEKEKKMN